MAARVTSRESRSGAILLALPALLWLGLFFLLPLIFVVVISFLTRGAGGSAVLPFTLAQYTRVFDTFWIILQRTLVTAFVTTIICLVAGYPLAYFITKRQTNFGKQFALFLVILPFWTNFLIRTYAWRVILGREGIINSTLMNAGIITEPLTLLNTEFAVILGLVYGFLPFMVLPIYASLSRFDFRFIEAANDLGANDWTAFWRIMLPLTMPGVVAGCILVFIPAIGTFVTSDLLGGTKGLMIGNLIQGQYSGNGNMPLGAALSVVMMLCVVIALVFYVRFGEEK
ncbi:MAG: ABC transporter permease [Anaerolineae bacterium]|nr:ABC transporter permease [Chloroflexota bacterium]MBP6297951.1 ABC transporter permease [Anaerolineae bacterium]